MFKITNLLQVNLQVLKKNGNLAVEAVFGLHFIKIVIRCIKNMLLGNFMITHSVLCFPLGACFVRCFIAGRNSLEVGAVFYEICQMVAQWIDKVDSIMEKYDYLTAFILYTCMKGQKCHQQGFWVTRRLESSFANAPFLQLAASFYLTLLDTHVQAVCCRMLLLFGFCFRNFGVAITGCFLWQTRI